MNRIIAIASLAISIISGFYCLESLQEMWNVLKESKAEVHDSPINATVVAGGIKLSLSFIVVHLIAFGLGVYSWLKKEKLGLIAVLINFVFILISFAFIYIQFTQ